MHVDWLDWQAPDGHVAVVADRRRTEGGGAIRGEHETALTQIIL